MGKRAWISAAVVVWTFAGAWTAEASWTRPAKHPVSSWDGFRNSANGAVQNLLPWNWLAKSDERPRYRTRYPGVD